MMTESIRKGGEFTTCPKCGAAAITLHCRKGFVPSIKCIDSIDGGAWNEARMAIKQTRATYSEDAAVQDALDFLEQLIELSSNI